MPITAAATRTHNTPVCYCIIYTAAAAAVSHARTTLSVWSVLFCPRHQTPPSQAAAAVSSSVISTAVHTWYICDTKQLTDHGV